MTLARVRSQYEALPYPPRDPEHDTRLLQGGLLGQVTAVNHVLWGGRRTFDRDFAILEAGCGTGDGPLLLAEQLRATDARIVALDFSSASLSIARRRAATRGLRNIEFVHSPIEEIPGLGLGQFDYILSTGVLHHLESPELGLAVLRDSLKPDGGLGVMLYGLYGRRAIYDFQELMRYLAPASFDDADRLARLKQTMAELPPNQRTLRALREGTATNREIESGDAALFDLLLHTQDRPFTVPNVYEWLRGAGMRVARWGTPATYDPGHYAPGLDVDHLDEEGRAAVAELLHGGLAKHSFYAILESYSPPVPPAPDDLNAVPEWAHIDVDGVRREALQSPGSALSFTTDGIKADVSPDPLTRGLLRRIDGKTPAATIIARTTAEVAGVREEQAREVWLNTARALVGMSVLVLNDPG